MKKENLFWPLYLFASYGCGMIFAPYIGEHDLVIAGWKGGLLGLIWPVRSISALTNGSVGVTIGASLLFWVVVAAIANRRRRVRVAVAPYRPSVTGYSRIRTYRIEEDE